MNKTIIRFLPEATLREIKFLEDLCADMSIDDLEEFLIQYKTRRKSREIIIILAAVGFFGVAGIHRFFMNDIIIGVLYLITGGFCFIGTIVDLANSKNLMNNYNENMAFELVDDFFA